MRDNNNIKLIFLFSIVFLNYYLLYTSTVPLQAMNMKEKVSSRQELFQKLLHYCTASAIKCTIVWYDEDGFIESDE